MTLLIPIRAWPSTVEAAVDDLATTQRRKSLTSLAWHPEADRSGAWSIVSQSLIDLVHLCKGYDKLILRFYLLDVPKACGQDLDEHKGLIASGLSALDPSRQST